MSVRLEKRALGFAEWVLDSGTKKFGNGGIVHAAQEIFKSNPSWVNDQLFLKGAERALVALGYMRKVDAWKTNSKPEFPEEDTESHLEPSEATIKDEDKTI